MGQVGRMKSKTAIVEMNCDCGDADGIEDMVRCDYKNGFKSCIVWKHNLLQMLNLKKHGIVLNTALFKYTSNDYARHCLFS